MTGGGGVSVIGDANILPELERTSAYSHVNIDVTDYDESVCRCAVLARHGVRGPDLQHRHGHSHGSIATTRTCRSP